MEVKFWTRTIWLKFDRKSKKKPNCKSKGESKKKKQEPRIKKFRTRNYYMYTETFMFDVASGEKKNRVRERKKGR